ncbi:carboxypeptidase regulatory-like domain-containing protein [Glycomyces sp. MUSA5-2]|uniref:carboxypeptidase regulatory-like domain-containing protein n=1 Tax=Glycomyces sp. MUSA5-2 TaxID=2053002 RepID=UPI00300B6F9F
MTVAAAPSGTQGSAPRSPRRRRGALASRLAGLAAAGGVLLLGVLAFPQAAMAQGQFTATINSQNPFIDIGGAPASVSVTLAAAHNDPMGKDADVSAELEGIGDYAYITVQDGGGCTITGDTSVKCEDVPMGQTRNITFLINPYPDSDLPAGQQEMGQFKVKYNGGDTSTNVTVTGNAQNSVNKISGKVTSNGEPVEGAKVVLKDGEGNERDTETGGDGGFEFTGGGNPIKAGDMTLTITKEGFEEKVEEFTVESGDFNRNVTLAQVQEEETSSAAPTTEAAPSPEPSETKDEDGGGISGTLLFLIIIGALLVIGGIVGIVFLLRGGKDKDDDDGESFAPDGPPEHKPTAAQVGSPGVYQAGPAPGSEAPTMIHPGGLVDGAAAAPTAFGPAYGGGSDSTQVMPQGGFGAPPAGPGPVGPDGTTILPVVKQPGGPGASDATQIMPQANLSNPPAAPHGSFGADAATRPHPSPTGAFGADPGATRPHPSPTGAFSDPGATRPHPGAAPTGSFSDPGATRPYSAPTPPPSGGGMFEPQNPGLVPGAPSEPRHGGPSAPQYGPGSQNFGGGPAQPSQPQGYGQSQNYGQPGQGFGGGQGGPSQPQGYGAHGAPSAPQEPTGYGQSMRRDPYAPSEPSAPPAGTRPMPQYGNQSQPSAPSYGSEADRDPDDPDSRRTERRSWGEWDDRPRSW